jgi:hypothetical protein
MLMRLFDRKINALNRPGDPNNQLSRGLTWNKVGRAQMIISCSLCRS